MKKGLVTFLSLIALIGVGCKTDGPVAPTPPKQFCSDGRDLPAWTIKGGMAFPADAGKVFYGTGAAANISNPVLLREAADNRAINELAKQFNVYTSSLMEDYMASTSAEDKGAEEQNVEVVKKTVVKESLSGVVIADRCQESVSGTFYSLARLDLDAFSGILERKAGISDKMKEFVRANAARMAEKLNREESK